MSIYAKIDEFGLKTASKLMKNVRYFSDNTKSRNVIDVIDNSAVQVPDFSEEGYYQCGGSVNNLEIDPGFLVKKWIGRQKPTIIYHHGAAEGSYLFSFNRIFRKKELNTMDCNIIAVKAPFSESNKSFFQAIRDMKVYTALIAGSVVTIENIIAKLNKHSSAPVFVTGISLGGFVTCLHSQKYHTASAYMPLYAGPQVAEVFISSAYKVICNIEARTKKQEEIRQALNFGDQFRGSNQDNVYPLLGKNDRIFDINLNEKYYLQENLRTTEKGHSTGSSDSKVLRAHIQSVLTDTLAMKRETA